MVQRDIISEQRLAAIIGDDKRLRDVSDQLIQHASQDYTVKAYWITRVTGVCPQTLASLRDDRTIEANNVSSKSDPRWRYDIITFMGWYKQTRN